MLLGDPRISCGCVRDVLQGKLRFSIKSGVTNLTMHRGNIEMQFQYQY